ncbi:cytochrome c oxidase assembly protein [Sanguibacter suaedae]|uniref:cytochrome c oxidase assembly protein n=1 Tax=Sanguibacter suaedae TaxID=2795737 RepID=UPI0027DB8AFC|nr:cytochrome c oxidase assembly protein [Sanguibacter suaedae]
MTRTTARGPASDAARPSRGGPAAVPATAPAVLAWSVPAMVAVAVCALVVAGALTTAFAPQLLLDPGPVVRWGLPLATVVAELGVAVTLGGLFLAAFVVPPGPALARTTGIVAVGSGVWAVAALARAVLTAANTVGLPLDGEGFGDQLGVYLTQLPTGQALLSIALVAATVSVLAALVPSATGALWTSLLVVAALVLQSLMGHASGSTSHELAVSSMMLHLVGAAVWVGGLLVIALLRLRGSLLDEELPVVLARFSPAAAWCVVLVALSGSVNGVIRLGGLEGLSTGYGVLLVVKTALLVVLGLLGWAHRRWVIGRVGGAPALFWRLAAVELLVMGAVSGVAVALGGTPPPDDNAPPPDPTPAYIVTGRELPPEPTLARWFTEWRWDVLLGFACVAAVVVYLRWVRRLRRRGDAWPPLRTVMWCTGLVVMFWVTNGGPAVYGSVLFSAHMVQHMILAMVVPLLLVQGAPVTLAVRAMTARKDGTRGGREWLLAIVHSRYGRFFAHPLVAAVNFAGSMVVFYYTPAFEYALSTHVGHLLMTVHFTLAGYFFANALVGIDPGPSRPAHAQRLLLLLATMAFHAFFGVALMSGEILLVPEWFGLMGREWGLPALEDQQRGGEVAWGIGEVPTVFLAIMVAVSWSRSEERVAKRRDRRVDREGDLEMDEYNAMLERLSERDRRS